MLLDNNTSLSNDYLLAILQECVDGYIALYERAHSEVKFIVFDSMESIKKCRQEMAEEPDNDDYDGNFIPPKEKTDVLTILALIKDKNIRGAEQYFMEKSKGSLRDGTISDRKMRGEKLMAFFEFAEMIQHEYSHLCSFEKMMTATDWADPLIMGTDWNYHLHDEFIARYRGTRTMLHMATPYAEKDLLYSLWMGYWNNLNRDFKTHIEATNDFLKEQRKGIEEEILQFMKQSGMGGTDMVHELESELGHKLYFGGELTKCGVPKMCPMEVAEFLTFGATQKRTIPIMYSIKNSYASYHGSQLLGLIQAFHDHFSENIQTDGMELEESDLDLTNTIGIPFYDYADAGKAQRTLERFIQIFTDNNS